jgi:hypothetical protein
MATDNAQSIRFLDFDIYQIPENEPISQYLRGSNRKQFLIILHCSEEEEKDLIPYLEKILSTISIQLTEDTHYIILPKLTTIAIHQIIRRYGINKIMVFGIEPGALRLNITFPYYSVFSFIGKKWLIADALQTIFLERKEKKRPKAEALWNALTVLQHE